MALTKQKSGAVEQRSKRIDFPQFPAPLRGMPDIPRWNTDMERWYYELRTVLQRTFEDVAVSTTAGASVAYNFIDTETVKFTVAGNDVSAIAIVKDGKDGKDGTDGRDGRDGRDGKDGKDGKDGRDGTNGTDGADGREPSGATAECVDGQLIITFEYPP